MPPWSMPIWRVILLMNLGSVGTEEYSVCIHDRIRTHDPAARVPQRAAAEQAVQSGTVARGRRAAARRGPGYHQGTAGKSPDRACREANTLKYRKCGNFLLPTPRKARMASSRRRDPASCREMGVG